jgi:hypothetical protein
MRAERDLEREGEEAMRRITVLFALTAGMAIGVGPAHASVPVPGLDQQGGQANVSELTQGDPTATGGGAGALGGNGGNASTGNTQALNGNSVSLAVGGKQSDAKAAGGSTSAKSGDAYGGDGGSARATGGDAGASNDARVGQANAGGGHGESSRQENGSSIEQGSPTADGGDAQAQGGDGGDADTGNTQIGNGNAIAVSVGGKHSDASARGGDTSAKSEDAYGGDGGDANATGGDADASNDAGLHQSNESADRHHHGYDCGSDRKKDDEGSSQSNESSVKQGDPTADGGEAAAEGGDGGSADTGNEQYGNGNAWAEVFPHEGDDQRRDCDEHRGRTEADAWGGDTSTKSGDAFGGDGGNAKASGGDATAWNAVRLLQLNAASKEGWL